MPANDPYQLFLSLSNFAQQRPKPDVNKCNHYLFDRIDDIVDRVPNSQIELHYGCLTPDRIDTPSVFWQTVIGQDHVRDIAVIAHHNNADINTTIKTLNFFGSLFLETQNTAQTILKDDEQSEKADLRQALTEQNRFISWTASQLCMDIAIVSGDAHINPKFRLNIFDDCSKTTSLDDQCALKERYFDLFQDYSQTYPTGAFDQYKNDLRDTIKDLGIYLCLYPNHVTTNTVLTHYQNSHPGAQLISLDSADTDVRRGNHPLRDSFMAVCHQTGIAPDSFEISAFDKAKELPEFTSLGDSPKWQKIKSETVIVDQAAIIDFRSRPPQQNRPSNLSF